MIPESTIKQGIIERIYAEGFPRIWNDSGGGFGDPHRAWMILDNSGKVLCDADLSKTYRLRAFTVYELASILEHGCVDSASVDEVLCENDEVLGLLWKEEW